MNHFLQKTLSTRLLLAALGVCLMAYMTLATQVQAQAIDLNRELEDIAIIGADASVEPLVRITLNARKGTPLKDIDLPSERNRILELGKFSEVSLSIEDRGNGPVLNVSVKQNPAIAEVRILDDAFPAEWVLEVLERQNLLTPGAIYDTRRAQEAKETLQKVYRDNGYPFDINPVLEVTKSEQGMVLSYAIESDMLLEEIRFGSSEIFKPAELSEAFDYPVSTPPASFDFNQYRQAAASLAQAYEGKGYRGSGLDLQKTSLDAGVLQVAVRELKIVGIDTLEVGLSPEELSLAEGDLFNYDVLLDDIARLSLGRDRDISLEYPSTAEGEVRVILRAGEAESSGTISNVFIEGSTVFSEAELAEQLRLGRGNNFSSELANEDYRRLRDYYEERGYALVGEPNFEYDQGRYIQRVREVRISDYTIEVEEGTAQRTRPDVILRYLPKIGSAFNRDAVRNGLYTVAGAGAVEPVDFNLSFPDSEIPSNAVANIRIRESRSRIFSPSLTYAPDSGLNAEASYTDGNFLGLGHNFNVGFAGQSSDLGLRLGGNISYSIPWLYADFLDFQQVPTSISFSAFSNSASNQALTQGDGNRRALYPNLEDISDNQVLIGEYSRRDTGASLTFGRNVAENLRLQLGVRGSYSNYELEPNKKPCEIDNATKKVKDRNCELPAEFSLTYLAPNGFNTFLSTDLNFDNRDAPAFPTRGIRAFTGVGFGFGSDFISPTTKAQANYNYQQITAGFRTYAAPADNQVFAFRVDVGHQFGGEYPTNRYFTVGNTPNENTQLRGFTRNDINPSRSYALGSVEYRYDFGLASAVTQTLIGIAFVDMGYVSDIIDYDTYSLPFPVSAGIGLQINIGSAAGILAPIRLDYGFSERHPTGALSFRLGYAF